MNETTNGPVDEVLGDVDISYPLIQAGSIENLIIRGAEVKYNTEKQTRRIVFNVETTRPTTSTQHTDLPAGFRFQCAINGESGKRDRAAVVKDLGVLFQAVYGKGKSSVTYSQAWENPGVHLNDKPIVGKIKIAPAKEGYEARNEATWVIPA